MVGHNSKAGKIVRYILTTLLMLVMIYPFIYLVLNSFAAWDQVDKKLIPTEFTTRSWDWLFGNSVVAAPARGFMRLLIQLLFPPLRQA